MKKLLTFTASIVMASVSLSSVASAKQVKIAMANVDMEWLNTSRAANSVCHNAQQAARNKAKLIVFAESFVGGYPLWHYSHPKIDIAYNNQKYGLFWDNGTITLDGPEIRRMRQCARSSHIAMVVPINERQEGAYNKTIFNTSLFIDRNGKLKHITRKAKGVQSEQLFYNMAPKDPDIRVVKLAGLNVAYNAGWQIFSPVIRAIQYAQGAQLIIASTQDFGTKWEKFMATVATEGRVYVASTSNMYKWDTIKKADPAFSKEMQETLQNVTNTKTPKLQPGLALFVAPDGRVLSHSKEYESKIVYGTVDTKQIMESSLYRDTSSNYRLPIDVTYRGRTYVKDGYPVDKVID